MGVRTEPEVSLEVRIDNPLVNEAGGSVRHVVAHLRGADIAEAHEMCVALDLALVIDCSGSMRGNRLANAKLAAREIVDCLNENDFLSVVAFASEAELLLSGAGMSTNGKRDAASVLGTIETRGGTNLADGWLCGAEAVALAAREAIGRVCRVLVLTDGKANLGVTDPEMLSKMAADLADRGIISSCVGIGSDYSTTQVHAIAEYGGGILHDVEHADEISQVVMGEFRDTLRTVAENAVIRLEAPNCRIESLGRFRTTGGQDEVACHVGNIQSGRSRQVVFRVFFPPDRAVLPDELAAEAAWKSPGTGEHHTCQKVRIPIKLVDPREITTESYCKETGRIVAERWHAHVMFDSVEMNRDGAYQQANDYIKHNLRYFTRYCRRIPGCEDLVSEMHRLLNRINRPFEERSRKNMQQMSYSRLKGSTDYSKRRADWRHELNSAPGSGRAMRAPSYRIELCDGHILVKEGGTVLVLDSGAPMSISNTGNIRFAGAEHAVNSDFLGFNSEQMSEFIGTHVDGLLGMDILRRFNLECDIREGRLTLVENEPVDFPVMLKMDLSMIVPVLNVQVDGEERRLVLDSGAKLSYLQEDCCEGLLPSGQVDDFYPTMGRFSVPYFDLRLGLEGEEMTVSFGRLPQLLELMLGAFGAEGILGSPVFQMGRTHMAFKSGMFFWRPYDN